MEKTKLTANKGRLLVMPLKTDDTTKGGIVLPQTAQASNLGGVVAVGQEVQIPYGAIVVFPEYTGCRFNYDNQELIGLKEEDVIAWDDSHRSTSYDYNVAACKAIKAKQGGE